MASEELRESLAALLEITRYLIGGGRISSEELRDLEKSCDEIEEGLKRKKEPPEVFPDSHWVFCVQRTQRKLFSVSAKNDNDAWCKAAVRLHGDVEAMRFTWDDSNPLDLSPLQLERTPNV